MCAGPPQNSGTYFKLMHKDCHKFETNQIDWYSRACMHNRQFPFIFCCHSGLAVAPMFMRLGILFETPLRPMKVDIQSLAGFVYLR